MTLKTPTSEQKESMDFLFRTRNHHKDNFIEWLSDCREAAVQKVISSPPELTNYAVGELNAIDSFLKKISSL